MKFGKLIAFSLLITLNAIATEQEELELALPSLVEEFFDYCTEIQPDDEKSNENILNCVNTQLSDSGFNTFPSYSELIAYMNKEEDE